MEQKEAELEKEIDSEVEMVPAESLKPDDTAVAVDDAEANDAIEENVEAATPEEDEALLPLASGVGSRLKRRTAASKVSRKTADLAPVAENEQDIDDTDADQNDYPLAGWRYRREETKGLGRGGLAAVALLVIFVPFVVYLLIVLYNTNDRIDSVRKNLADFNNNAAINNDSTGTTSAETALVQLLNRPTVKILPLKVENLSPTGHMVFYTDGNTLALTYGNLDSLSTNQMYSVWISNKTAGSSDAAYARLANIPDDHSLGKALIINKANLPAGFNVANYAEIFVTVEPADKNPDKPTGARAFSLDLSKLKS